MKTLLLDFFASLPTSGSGEFVFVFVAAAVMFVLYWIGLKFKPWARKYNYDSYVDDGVPPLYYCLMLIVFGVVETIMFQINPWWTLLFMVILFIIFMKLSYDENQDCLVDALGIVFWTWVIMSILTIVVVLIGSSQINWWALIPYFVLLLIGLFAGVWGGIQLLRRG